MPISFFANPYSDQYDQIPVKVIFCAQIPNFGASFFVVTNPHFDPDKWQTEITQARRHFAQITLLKITIAIFGRIDFLESINA